MRGLFYNLVESITDNITGLNHENLKIWEFHTWAETSSDVTVFLNIISLIGVIGISYTLYKTIEYILKRFNKEKVGV